MCDYSLLERLKFKNAGRVSAVLTREITGRKKVRENRPFCKSAAGDNI